MPFKIKIHVKYADYLQFGLYSLCDTVLGCNNIQWVHKLAFVQETASP